MTLTRLQVACFLLNIAADASQEQVKLLQSVLHRVDKPLITRTLEHRVLALVW